MSTVTTQPEVAIRESKPIWIVGRFADLILFVATPLLIVPIVWGAWYRWSSAEISLFVASFGAVGHHLPGMMRAYGDRELFRRFRVRFIVAPLFLVVVCWLFTVQEWKGITLIVTIWGVWHGLMQTYGFARIYDAKVGAHGRRTAWLDFAMCLLWFSCAYLFSSDELLNRVKTLYECGAPLIPASWLEMIRAVIMIATGLVTVAFFINYFHSKRLGRAQNPLKLLLMVVTFSYFWFCMSIIGTTIVGIAMFELFHDVQYLAIVWIYNRNRVDKGLQVGSFTRLLFRKSGALVGAYVGLVLAYGYLGFFSTGMLPHGARDALLGLLVASTLLHFYFDGFIWKVRERATSESLGVDGKRGIQATGPLTGTIVHSFKWGFFVVPVVLLAWGQTSHDPTEEELTSKAVQTVPESSMGHFLLGAVLEKAGRNSQAIQSYQQALKLRPDYADAHNRLGTLIVRNGDVKLALHHLKEAIRIDPHHADASNNLGSLFARIGQHSEAIFHFEQALLASPNDVNAHTNLAGQLAATGQVAAAERHLREALRLQPDYAEAHLNLGNLFARKGEFQQACRHYRLALEAKPNMANAHFNLGNALLELGRHQEAAANYRREIEINPGHPLARKMLDSMRHRTSSE